MRARLCVRGDRYLLEELCPRPADPATDLGLGSEKRLRLPHHLHLLLAELALLRAEILHLRRRQQRSAARL